MKNRGEVQISFRAATVSERVVTWEKQWHVNSAHHPLAYALGSECGRQVDWRLPFMNYPG